MAKSKRKATNPKVRRRITFYQAYLGTDSSKYPIHFEHEAYLSRVRDLVFTSNNSRSRYWTRGDGRAVSSWPGPSGSGKARFGSIRRTGLPQIEDSGSLTPIEIDQSAGIADITHVRFFDANVVGIMRNGMSPLPTTIGSYLGEKVTDLDAPQFLPLVRRNVLDELDRLGELTAFRVSVLRPHIEAVKKRDESLHSALKTTAELGSAECIDIVIKHAPYSRAPLGKRVRRMIKKLISSEEDAREIFRTLEVEGYNEETESKEAIDLLASHISSERNVRLESDRTRVLDTRSAFSAIEKAYDQLRHTIENGVVILGS